jgi:nitroreductase
MSTATAKAAAPPLAGADVAAAVALATRAPSLHNTQPWRWDLRGGVLELRADWTRQLHITDSDGHSLLVSCGAALALAELGLRTTGRTVGVDRFPDRAEPDLLARLSGGAFSPAPEMAKRWALAARTRQSERRPFGPQPVTDPQLEQLRSAAWAPDAYVHFAVRPSEALALAVSVSHADRVEREDPAYLAETARWMRTDADQADGVPSSVVPHVSAAQPRHTDVPLRDFELGVRGGQLIEAGVDEKPLLAVVMTTGNLPIDQLLAGEAMMRMMLEAEALGLCSCALSQDVDMPAFRSRLKTMMGWPSYPQMMVRIGARPDGAPAALTSRRPLSDVLTIT